MQARRYAGFGILLLCLSLAVFLVTNTAYFRIQDISVVGAVRVSAHEVVALSGLQRGGHIFGFKTENVRSQVMAHPWVLSVDVRRHFPGVVQIGVTERTPLACAPYHNGFLILDEEGRVLDFATDGEIPYPVITGWSPTSAAAGDFIRSAGMLAGLRCVLAAPPEMRDRISEVAVEKDQTVVLYLMGGLRVYFGQADAQAEKRFLVLKSVLEDIEGNKIDALYVDLRYQNPVIKTRK